VPPKHHPLNGSAKPKPLRAVPGNAGVVSLPAGSHLYRLGGAPWPTAVQHEVDDPGRFDFRQRLIPT
jgi:hypothetical protein